MEHMKQAMLLHGMDDQAPHGAAASSHEQSPVGETRQRPPAKAPPGCPPPPRQPPPVRTNQRPPPKAPPGPPPMAHLSQDYVCYDLQCRASCRRCERCQRLRDMPPPYHYSNRRFLSVLSELTGLLSNLPGHLVPSEVMVGTEDAMRRGGMQPYHDYGNYAGSMLLLAMLRPLCFGNPNGPPLRLLGYPHPSVLLRISSSGPQSGHGIDKQAKELLNCLDEIWC